LAGGMANTGRVFALFARRSGVQRNLSSFFEASTFGGSALDTVKKYAPPKLGLGGESEASGPGNGKMPILSSRAAFSLAACPTTAPHSKVIATFSLTKAVRYSPHDQSMLAGGDALL